MLGRMTETTDRSGVVADSVGFALGGVVAALALVMPFYELYSLSLAILAVGYTAGAVLAYGRSTHGLGVGLLVGMTLLLGVGVLILLVGGWGAGGD